MNRSGSGGFFKFKAVSFFSVVEASNQITNLLLGKDFFSIHHDYSPSVVKTLASCDANAPAL